jgi:hypothetical protein
MKKNTTAKRSPKALSKGKRNQIGQVAAKQRLTVGLDLGDRTSRYCVLDEAGEVVSEGQLPTTKMGLSSLFGKMPVQPSGAGSGNAFAMGKPAGGGHGA